MIVNVHEAKTHLSRLLADVEAGHDVVIGRAGVPIARLVPYGHAAERRRPGALRGAIHIADDFDETPAEILDDFDADDFDAGDHADGMGSTDLPSA